MPDTTTLAGIVLGAVTTVTTAGVSIAKAMGVTAKIARLREDLTALEHRIAALAASVRAEIAAIAIGELRREVQRFRDQLAELSADVSAIDGRLDQRESAEGDERATLANTIGRLQASVDILLQEKRR